VDTNKPVTIREILGELTATEGIVGSALVGLDGILVADNFVVDANLEKITALMSSVYNTLEKVFGELKQGAVGQAWFETDRHNFLLQPTPVGLIVAVANHDAPVGLIRLAVRRARSQLDKI